MLRFFAVCCMGLMTSACVIVGSDKPLFTAADAQGMALRPGLWTMPDDTCKYDPVQPVSAWPSCANGMVLTATQLTGGFGKSDPPQTMAYLLAGGDPPVVQVTAPPDRKPDDPYFIYAGLRPGRTDSSGRIVEARVWLAACFKPPTDLNSKAAPRPFVGLTLKKGASYCKAVEPEAVRNAVAKSEVLSVKGDKLWVAAHWVRDGGK